MPLIVDQCDKLLGYCRGIFVVADVLDAADDVDSADAKDDNLQAEVLAVSLSN